MEMSISIEYCKLNPYSHKRILLVGVFFVCKPNKSISYRLKRLRYDRRYSVTFFSCCIDAFGDAILLLYVCNVYMNLVLVFKSIFHSLILTQSSCQCKIGLVNIDNLFIYDALYTDHTKKTN